METVKVSGSVLLLRGSESEARLDSESIDPAPGQCTVGSGSDASGMLQRLRT